MTNGVVTAIVGTAGTSANFANSDTITVPDPTGNGVVLTNNGNAGTLATANWTVSNGGTPSLVSPASFFSGPIYVKVNGNPIRDLTATQLLNRNQANGFPDQTGVLSLHFSEPWRRFRNNPDITALDLTPDSSGALSFTDFEITANISAFGNQAGQAVSLVAFQVFDFQTTVDHKGNRLVNYITLHQVQQYLAAGGLQPLANVPKADPIVRLWALGATPGNITEMQVNADNVFYLKGNVQGPYSIYGENGFTFNQPLPANSTASAPTNNTSIGSVGSNVFDAAYISDPEQRLDHATMIPGGSLTVYITSAVAQNVSVIVEALPGHW